MKVLYIFSDQPQELNCSRWNCLIPAEAINRTEGNHADCLHVDEFTLNTKLSQELCFAADIIVLERSLFGDTLTMVQFWKSRGKTVVGIFDDAYDLISPLNPAYDFWKFGDIIKTDAKEPGKIYKIRMKVPPIEQFKWGVRMVKAVQVPSLYLQKDWSVHNPNTYYVHNYLDMEKYKGVKPLYLHDKDKILIGWCGSLSHRASFNGSGILDALKKVAARRKNIVVLIGGDKSVYDRLEVANKVYQPYVPFAQWEMLLKTLDIGLCPLHDEFDKRRTWIKALEYMAVKVPWIASDFPTYSELSEYGILTPNGHKEWIDAIETMVDKIAEYKEKAETVGYEFALSQSSDANITKTLELYQEIIKMPYA